MMNKEIALQYLNKGLSVIPLISPSMLSRQLTDKEIIDRCKRTSEVDRISESPSNSRRDKRLVGAMARCKHSNRYRENFQPCCIRHR
jgi:hypothetical protein